MKAELDVIERLNNIESVLEKNILRKSDKLLEYYVFDYPPESELPVREHIAGLAKKYGVTNSSFNIKLFNLYEMIIQILKDEDFFEQCNDLESDNDYTYLAEEIANAIDVLNKNGPIFSKIKSEVSKSSIVFITGVGSAYPIIRVNSVLRILKSGFDEIGLGDIPVVLFYPGKYLGEDSLLFGTIGDNFYYLVERFPCDCGQKIE